MAKNSKTSPELLAAFRVAMTDAGVPDAKRTEAQKAFEAAVERGLTEEIAAKRGLRDNAKDPEHLKKGLETFGEEMTVIRRPPSITKRAKNSVGLIKWGLLLVAVFVFFVAPLPVKPLFLLATGVLLWWNLYTNEPSYALAANAVYIVAMLFFAAQGGGEVLQNNSGGNGNGEGIPTPTPIPSVALFPLWYLFCQYWPKKQSK